MGAFSFTPRADETYRLKITSSHRRQRRADAARGLCGTRSGADDRRRACLPPRKPLEFNIRAAKAGVPLVVAAYCRGVQVGQQPLVTKAGATAPIRWPFPWTVRSAA